MFSRIFPYTPHIVMTGSLFGGYFTMLHKHTLGSQSKKRVLSYYQDSDHAFDAGTQHIIDEVTDHFLLNVPVSHMASAEFFLSNQPNPIHLGAMGQRLGFFVGIPISFQYKATSDINTAHMKFSKPVVIDSPYLQQLLDSLVLSEKAKKFAIASELNSANSYHVKFKATYIYMIFAGGLTINKASNLLQQISPLFQIAFLIGLVASWTAFYLLFQGQYDRYRQKAADKKTAQIGQEYLDGGIEYVSKLIQRNLASRELEGMVGPLLYDEKGNHIQGLLEISVLPLTDRLAYLQTLRKTPSEEDEGIKPES